METSKIGLSLGLLVLAGCAPVANTGNPDADKVIDLVVSREAPFHECLEVTSESGLVANFPEHYGAPDRGGWDINQFRDPKVADAAKRIAVSLSEAMTMERESKVLHLFGKRQPNSDQCPMSVSFPRFSGSYAFLFFSNPNGEVGHFALKRNGIGWRVQERVYLGVF